LLAGDLGQQVFQTPFSWKSVGVDLRGRSHTLRINYRTSHQIRKKADKLLPKRVADVDGVADDRDQTLSVFNGPAPEIAVARDVPDETRFVAAWLRARTRDGIKPHELAIFVRSDAEIARAKNAVGAAGLQQVTLTGREDAPADKVVVGTMHAAKGLEFRAVAVIACDEQVIPLAERVQSAADESELLATYDSERQLFYVACTRARDHLLVIGVQPASEFLDDMGGVSE
jgi:superfamily I DNA/RNA helicase